MSDLEDTFEPVLVARAKQFIEVLSNIMKKAAETEASIIVNLK